MALLVVSAVIVAMVAALLDVRTGKIPNWLTLGALALGLLERAGLAVLADGPSALPLALLASLAGAALAGAVPLMMFRMRALGGGDVKLFAALGALFGPTLGLEVELLSFVSAAFLAPLYLAWRGILLETVRRSLALVVSLILRRRCPPVSEAALSWFRLGPAVLAGTLWAVAARELVP